MASVRFSGRFNRNIRRRDLIVKKRRSRRLANFALEGSADVPSGVRDHQRREPQRRNPKRFVRRNNTKERTNRPINRGAKTTISLHAKNNSINKNGKLIQDSRSRRNLVVTDQRPQRTVNRITGGSAKVGSQDRERPSRVAKTSSALHVAKYFVNKYAELVQDYKEMRQTYKQSLEVKPSAIHGKGLFTKRKFWANDLIIEYEGERISKEESNRRERLYKADGIRTNMMFALDESWILDPTRDKKNIGKMVNHSCEPNTKAETLRVGGQRRILIMAKKRIEAGEELTIDYLFDVSYRRAVPCNCESTNCRDYIDAE